MKRPTIAAPWVHTAFLVEYILSTEGVTAADLARHLEVSLAFIRSLLDARKPLPPRLAKRLQAAGFGGSTKFVRAHLDDVAWRYMEGIRRA